MQPKDTHLEPIPLPTCLPSPLFQRFNDVNLAAFTQRGQGSQLQVCSCFFLFRCIGVCMRYEQLNKLGYSVFATWKFLALTPQNPLYFLLGLTASLPS